MLGIGLSLLLNAAPSIYKLFTSDDKTEAVKDLTKNVLTSATNLIGVKVETKDDLVKQLGEKPELVIVLKKIDNEFAIKIEELKLESKKLDYENEKNQEENITERWKSDNSADSRFAKLLRPGLTAYLIIVATIFAIIDGNMASFNIKTQWIELFSYLCTTTIGGYFILRTFEKRTGTSVWKK